MNQEKVFQGVAPLIARLLFAGVLLANALGLAAGFREVVPLMASKGIPLPAAGLAGVIAAWLFGGACLLVGYRVRWAALALAALMLAVTIGMHAPWTAEAAALQNEINQFLKNLGFIAGLLALAASPAGLLAVDARSGNATTQR